MHQQDLVNQLKAQVTTADTSIASGQYAQLVQRIEAQNLQQFRLWFIYSKKHLVLYLFM